MEISLLFHGVNSLLLLYVTHKHKPNNLCLYCADQSHELLFTADSRQTTQCSVFISVCLYFIVIKQEHTKSSHSPSLIYTYSELTACKVWVKKIKKIIDPVYLLGPVGRRCKIGPPDFNVIQANSSFSKNPTIHSGFTWSGVAICV